MSWRTVVITGIAKLDYKMDYLVVRKADATSRIHLSEIGVLVIESTAVSLTAMLLSELISRKVKVVFCDADHNPQSELAMYYGSTDTSSKIRNQIRWSERIKHEVWTQIVAEKIGKQAELLFEREKVNEGNMLCQYINEIELNDATNREGHAAKVYFNALFGLGFTRDHDDSINAALNYGYTVLNAYFNREITANGYLTQLGIHHDNMFNKFNLSSDLMEPFRILVDRAVCAMEPVKFESEEKMEILDIFNREVLIDDSKQVIGNAIKIYCHSVFEALNNNDTGAIKFYRNEL